MKISLAFTTYFSAKYIVQQLDRDYFKMSGGIIDEIVIQDDCSSDYDDLKKYQSDTVHVFRNQENLSPLLSRQNLVKNCKNDWVLLMDSDNFLDQKCFDVIGGLKLEQDHIYCPDFARPMFGFKQFSDITIDLPFASSKFSDIGMQILLNTGNYLVPRIPYLEVGSSIDISYSRFTVDVVYYNYLWLNSGRRIRCVKNYEYDHTMRGDSYWMTHSGNSKDKLAQVNSLYLQ